jgi:alkaline phosphatase
MPKYIDGFLLPVSKNKLEAYKKMAKLGAKLWKKYGALDYKECIADDLNTMGTPSLFPHMVKLKSNEVVVFSFIVYKSRAHRDRVMKKVMQDTSMEAMGKDMPFDMKRMAVAGFSVMVDV